MHTQKLVQVLNRRKVSHCSNHDPTARRSFNMSNAYLRRDVAHFDVFVASRALNTGVRCGFRLLIIFEQCYAIARLGTRV